MIGSFCLTPARDKKGANDAMESQGYSIEPVSHDDVAWQFGKRWRVCFEGQHVQTFATLWSARADIQWRIERKKEIAQRKTA